MASEPGTYRVVGAFAGRTANATITVIPRDAVRPTTLVGRLPVKGFTTTEFWLHPDGRHGYLSTLGDRLYAIDLADPAEAGHHRLGHGGRARHQRRHDHGGRPVRRPDARGRERRGRTASSCSRSRIPRTRRQVAEFTETVTGGVHSTFIYRGYVYLTDDATGSMRVIDIRDPHDADAGGALGDAAHRGGADAARHRRAGRAGLPQLLERRPRHPRRRERRCSGGSPENPQFVSQLKYDLERALPRRRGGRRARVHPRDPHRLAERALRLRRRRGLLGQAAGDRRPEPPRARAGLRPAARAWTSPTSRSRARWPGTSRGTAARTTSGWPGDTLYLGDYQGGLRVLDVCGELRGDLLAAGPGDRPRRTPATRRGTSRTRH